MRQTCAPALRALAVLYAAVALVLAPSLHAHAAENPHSGSLLAADAATSEPEAEPTHVAVENDPFTSDGYLDEFLVGAAAAIAVILLGGYLMRRA